MHTLCPSDGAVKKQRQAAMACAPDSLRHCTAKDLNGPGRPCSNLGPVLFRRSGLGFVCCVLRPTGSMSWERTDGQAGRASLSADQISFLCPPPVQSSPAPTQPFAVSLTTISTSPSPATAAPTSSSSLLPPCAERVRSPPSVSFALSRPDLDTLLVRAREADLRPIHGGMDRLVQFGRKAWFVVRVMSGYEERRIRSYRLQLQKRLEMAQAKKEELRKRPEQMILTEVRQVVQQMKALNQHLEEAETAIDEYFKPIDKNAKIITDMQLEKEEQQMKEMAKVMQEQVKMQKEIAMRRDEAANLECKNDTGVTEKVAESSPKQEAAK